MNKLCLLCVILFTALGASTSGLDEKKDKPDYAKLIVGTWEVTQSDGKDPAVGTVVEFRKDGTLRVTEKSGGKVESYSGVYKLMDNKIKVTLKLPDGDEEKDPIPIKSVSEKELILEGKTPVVHKRVK